MSSIGSMLAITLTIVPFQSATAIPAVVAEKPIDSKFNGTPEALKTPESAWRFAVKALEQRRYADFARSLTPESQAYIIGDIASAFEGLKHLLLFFAFFEGNTQKTNDAFRELEQTFTRHGFSIDVLKEDGAHAVLTKKQFVHFEKVVNAAIAPVKDRERFLAELLSNAENIAISHGGQEDDGNKVREMWSEFIEARIENDVKIDGDTASARIIYPRTVLWRADPEPMFFVRDKNGTWRIDWRRAVIQNLATEPANSN